MLSDRPADSAREHFPNQIDALNSAADITRFVQQIGGRDYHTYTVSDTLRFKDKRCETQLAKAGAKAWQKADFDGNGYSDLLLIGRDADAKSNVVCVLDSGNNRFYIEPFERQFFRTCAVPQVVYDGVLPLIRYVDYANSFYNTDSLSDRQEFLLTHRFGGFVEYTRKEYQYQIEKIEFTSSFAYHTSSQSELTIGADGKATYSFTEAPILAPANITAEHLTATISPRAYDEIASLLIYLNFPRLRNEYRLTLNHIPRSTLTVTYNRGRKKVIYDVGEAGTFGLRQVYALLHQLRRTQVWQPVQ
ncbi:hypothetical protein [Hymenobacter sp. BT491]|uniref:DUF6438 domain-containing protein n=1 Tax=Hymenobacter sp. BT491 TaxID=2766779 RepID=UPI001653A4D4|nr:hypothetical protein [Hymenobacter sp. BT491]MBC6988818.1 hypothetical protein [Hymenobacter sp. BT491]